MDALLRLTTRATIALALVGILGSGLYSQEQERRPKRSGESQAGPGARNRELSLPFNNATGVVRLEDGSVVAIYEERAQVRVRRLLPGGGTEEATLTTRGGSAIALAWDRSSTLVAIFKEGRELFAAFSEDGGKNFGEARVVTTEPKAQGPSARIWRTNGELVAVVAYHTGKDESGQVWTASFVGERWTEPARLDRGAGSWVTVAGVGDRTIAAWKDFRSGNREPDIYLAGLAAPGGEWSEEWAAGFSGADPCLAYDEMGKLHMGLQRSFQKLCTTVSTDDGRTWAKPREIGDSPGLFAAVVTHGPSTVVVAWEKFLRHGSHFDDSIKVAGLSVSTDGGETFRRIPVEEDRTSQICPLATVGANGIDFVWIDKTRSVLRHESFSIPPTSSGG